MKIKIFKSGSIGNLYTVNDGHTKIILECGISYKKIIEALGYNLIMYEACLVSHEHRDHARGIRGLAKSGMNVFVTHGTLKALNIDEYDGNYIPVKYQKEYTVGSFIIMPFKTIHDAEEPAGFILYSMKLQEKILFATDTQYLPYYFYGLNYIMIETNYDKKRLQKNVEAERLNSTLAVRIENNHFELANVKEYLTESNLKKVKKIYLLHLSRNNADPEQFVREVQELTGIETFTKRWE